jgi:hypothetical protein
MSATPSPSPTPKSGGWLYLSLALGLLALLVGAYQLPPWPSVSDGAGGPTYSIGSVLPEVIYCAVPLVLSWVAFRRRTGIALTLLSILVLGGSVVAFARASRELYWNVLVQVRVHQDDVQRDLRREWAIQAAAITPEVARYVVLFPERVHATGRNEFIRIEGVEKVLKAKWPGFTLKDNAILDPWGNPIQYGMFLNHESKVSWERDPPAVLLKNGRVVAIGVYSTGPDKDKGENWVTKGGRIERPKQ